MADRPSNERLAALLAAHAAGNDVLDEAEAIHAKLLEHAGASAPLDARSRRVAAALRDAATLPEEEVGQREPALRAVVATWSGKVLTPALRLEVSARLAEVGEDASSAVTRREHLRQRLADARAQVALLGELDRLLRALSAPAKQNHEE